VCEQVKITWSQVRAVRRVEKTSQAKSVSSARVLAVFTSWTNLCNIYTGHLSM
jgi:hypothetical protein